MGAYADGDPVNHVDPNGHNPCDFDDCDPLTSYENATAQRNGGKWPSEAQVIRYGQSRALHAQKYKQRLFPNLGGPDLARTCAQYLSCTISDIEALGVSDRLSFVDLINSGKESWYRNEGFAGWFNNVHGVIEAFGDKGLIQHGSWYSWSDAATLEAIESGLGEHLAHEAEPGLTGAAHGNTESPDPGISQWQLFFDYATEHPDDTRHLQKLWGTAEKTAVHWSAEFADTMAPRPASASDFITDGDVYSDALISEDFGSARSLAAAGKANDFCAGFLLCAYLGRVATNLLYSDSDFAPFGDPELFRQGTDDVFHLIENSGKPLVPPMPDPLPRGEA